LIDKVIDELRDNHALLVMLCIAAVVLLSLLFDLLLGKLGAMFRLHLPKRIMAILSIVLVAITYFTVVAATAIAFKALRRSPLSNPSANPSGTYWAEREKSEATLEYLKRQF
jgi:hypothetical protein